MSFGFNGIHNNSSIYQNISFKHLSEKHTNSEDSLSHERVIFNPYACNSDERNTDTSISINGASENPKKRKYDSETASIDNPSKRPNNSLSTAHEITLRENQKSVIPILSEAYESQKKHIEELDRTILTLHKEIENLKGTLANQESKYFNDVRLHKQILEYNRLTTQGIIQYLNDKVETQKTEILDLKEKIRIMLESYFTDDSFQELTDAEKRELGRILDISTPNN